MIKILKEDTIDINTIKLKVKDFLYELLMSNFEDNLAQEVHSAIPEYNPEWCVEDEGELYMKGTDTEEEIRNNFLDMTIESLFCHAE